jgi:hypothetical protein
MDVRLPGKDNSDTHGANPVHLIITMMKWIRTSRLSIKKRLLEEVDGDCFSVWQVQPARHSRE